MKKQTSAADMLHGSLPKEIVLFSLPLAATSILQQLFNAVDLAVIGHFASSEAQAAVGCSAPIINIVLNFLIGLSIGTTVVISAWIGRNEKEHIQAAVHTSAAFAILCGIVLMIAGYCMAKPLLICMDTPENVLNYAEVYLVIYFLGMPFILVYNFLAAILRCIGDTRRPLYCILFSGILNAGLNLFFVIKLHMDVDGVAIATVIANAVSAIMIWIFLVKEAYPLQLSWKKLRIAGFAMAKILQNGFPAGVQLVVFSISNLVIQIIINRFGAHAVAGSAITLNYECLAYFVIAAFSQAAITFTAQNYGAKNYARCRNIFWITMLLCTALIICISGILVIWQNFFIILFTHDAEVARYASVRMIYLIAPYMLICTYEISSGSLRGLGCSTPPALIAIMGICVFRLAWIFTVCRKYTDFETLMLVYPASWIVTGFCMLVLYFFVQKKSCAKL